MPEPLELPVAAVPATEPLEPLLEAAPELEPVELAAALPPELLVEELAVVLLCTSTEAADGLPRFPVPSMLVREIQKFLPWAPFEIGTTIFLGVESPRKHIWSFQHASRLCSERALTWRSCSLLSRQLKIGWQT